MGWPKNGTRTQDNSIKDSTSTHGVTAPTTEPPTAQALNRLNLNYYISTAKGKNILIKSIFLSLISESGTNIVILHKYFKPFLVTLLIMALIHRKPDD